MSANLQLGAQAIDRRGFLACGALGSEPGQAVARRWVRDRLLLRATLDGYESLLLRGRYPVAMLFLAAPPGEVDVNVHPTKAEVRFLDQGLMHEIVRRAVIDALGATPAPELVLSTPLPGGPGEVVRGLPLGFDSGVRTV